MKNCTNYLGVKMLILLLVVSQIKVSAQTFLGQDTTSNVITTAVPFLLIRPDARSAALGEAGVALSPDANASFWNPAKVAFIDGDYGATISYTPWLTNIVNDMFVGYLSGYYKITQEQAISLSFRFFDLGELQFTDNIGSPIGTFNPNELALTATYSRKLSEKIGLGVTARYFNSNLTGGFVGSAQGQAEPINSFSADLGFYYNTDLTLGAKAAELALGAKIANIGPRVSPSGTNSLFIPTNLTLGASLTTHIDPYNSFSFLLDFNKLMVPTPDPNRTQDPSLFGGIFGSFGDAPGGFSEELQEIIINAGVEYWYNELFAARVGYFAENQNKGDRQFFTLGVGFRYQVFGIDFAYIVPSTGSRENPLQNTLSFTLHFNFSQVLETESITDEDSGS